MKHPRALRDAAPRGRAAPTPAHLPSLDWQVLRALTVPPGAHPRAQPHLSAASGLVCAFGRVYVVADDEHHLGVFHGVHAPGRLHRVAAGDLPREAHERKARKADLETLMLVPAGGGGLVPGEGRVRRRRAAAAGGRDGATAGSGALWLLGSGSAAGRDRAFVQALDADGEPRRPARVVDLAPLYEPLRAHLGALNIEGAVMLPGQGLWLFNRGGSGARGRNAVARYRWPQVAAWLAGAPGSPAAGAAPALEPAWLRTVRLGAVRGVGYGFTDAAPLPESLGGGCLFTAVAEDSTDSVADGACVGSALGRLGPEGGLRWLRPLRGGPKVEGLALHAGPRGLTLCLATDADDPAVASQLLLAHLPARDLGAVRGRPTPRPARERRPR